MLFLWLAFATGWFMENQPLISLISGMVLLLGILSVVFLIPNRTLSEKGVFLLGISFLAGVSHDPIVITIIGGIIIILSLQVKKKKLFQGA